MEAQTTASFFVCNVNVGKISFDDFAGVEATLAIEPHPAMALSDAHARILGGAIALSGSALYQTGSVFNPPYNVEETDVETAISSFAVFA
jgi:hypothetical protein